MFLSQFSSVDMEEEGAQNPDSSSPASSPREELLLRKEKDSSEKQQDTEDDKSSAESVSKTKSSSLRLRSKRKKSTSPQNNGGSIGDCESQTSQFSRTSSTVGYRESFGINFFCVLAGETAVERMPPVFIDSFPFYLFIETCNLLLRTFNP
jgi:hypothetical protein